jgi:hypothetical protein
MNKGHFTQWAAQFAVASELCKRSYQVALTLGNHPAVDLMVISPNGQRFSIDVKGVKSRAGWLVRRHEPDDDLFYVFALVPKGKPNRYFVMTQQKVNEEIARRAKVAPTTPSGFLWPVVEFHEDKWGVLPA